MANGPLIDFLRQLRGNEALRILAERSDEELLEWFVARQEEAAFAVLVQRHGPMVLGVCRHLLVNTHDVEDAFQATFLVLVNKAAAIRSRTLLAGWLYRVAYRVAMRARIYAARRHHREVPGVEMMAAEQEKDEIDPQLQPILHQEVNRLPEKYRVPIVLCYLQGKTHEEAAQRLACPIGTVKGRLARARDLLRPRLARRGLSLSTTALAAVLTLRSASAAVPPVLLKSTLKTAMLIAAGQAATAGMVPVQVAALSQGVLRSMFLTKLTAVCIVSFGVAVLGAGAALLAHPKPQAAAIRPEAEPPAAVRAADNQEKPKKPEEKDNKRIEAARQRSANNLRGLMQAMHKYLDVNNHFPPAAIYDKAGKPLLSWRVLLLPYMNEDNLFKQFHLDEPWDSKHNKPLLAKMPKLYAPPLPGKTNEKNATFYQVFAGKGTIFEGKEGMGIADITDGTSCTISIIEAGEAVPWAKPVDLTYDDKKPLPKIGGLFDRGFNAALADGSANWYKRNFDVPTMRLAIKRNDGNPIDFNKLYGDK